MYLCAQCQPPTEIIRMFTSHGPCEDCKRVTVCYNWPPGERPELSDDERLKALRRDVANIAFERGWTRSKLELVVEELWQAMSKKGMKPCELEWVMMKWFDGLAPMKE